MNQAIYDVFAPEAEETSADALVPDGDTGQDFRLTSVEGVWITYRNLSVKLRPTDEGLVADIYAVGGENGDPIASTYAFFQEAIERVVEDCKAEVPDGVDERAAGVLALRELDERAARAHADLLDDASKAWVIAQLEAEEPEEVAG